MNPRGTTGFALFLVNRYSGVLDSLICAAEVFLFCLFFDYSMSDGLVSRDLIGIVIILPTIGISLPCGGSYVLFRPMSVGVGLHGNDAKKNRSCGGLILEMTFP